MIGTPESQADIADRRKVWDAWSELYLDTEITSKWEDGIAGLLAKSPYGRDALEIILWSEVHPACFLNILSVAGVWEGFDSDWLAARILRRRRRLFRLPYRLLPFRRLIAPAASRILSQVEAIRARPPASL